MEFDFPLENVEVAYSGCIVNKPSLPILIHPWIEIGEQEFYLNVNNVAQYSSQRGQKVNIFPYEGADEGSIRLFLNGSVLGAVMHQKGILPFHGSAIEYGGKGIIICGRSGVGKSSVTEAFCQNGARFINDDITPVRISKSGTTIIPIKTRIKLWNDSLKKLEIENDGFEKIRPGLDKFYLPVEEALSTERHLNHIIILDKHTKEGFEVNELDGMAKFNALRKQVYRKMYLKGMPETAKLYFKQLFQLAGTIRVTQIIRPQICDIYDAMNCIKKYLF